MKIPKLSCIFSAILVLLLVTQPASARDITSLVKQHSILEKRIVDGCRRYCLGNLREGKLIKVNIDRVDPIKHEVTALASFKNHQVISSELTGNFTLFNYTINIHVTGLLDQTSCELTVTKVDIVGDNAGLIKGAQRAVGRVVNVEKCGYFI